MKGCPSCSQENSDEANYCSQCGQALAPVLSESTEVPPKPTTSQMWEAFIGPSRSIQFSLGTGWVWRPAFLYYKDKFAKLETPEGPRFALSWNWPAAIFDSFLWFLYRKMYMFALLYAVAPALAIFLTGDMTVGLVSRVLAGASANYLYYWHMKDRLQAIMSLPNVDTAAQRRLIQDEGGVQPYVLWLGAALHLFMVGLLIAAISQGPPIDPQGVEGGGAPLQKYF